MDVGDIEGPSNAKGELAGEVDVELAGEVDMRSDSNGDRELEVAEALFTLETVVKFEANLANEDHVLYDEENAFLVFVDSLRLQPGVRTEIEQIILSKEFSAELKLHKLGGIPRIQRHILDKFQYLFLPDWRVILRTDPMPKFKGLGSLS